MKRKKNFGEPKREIKTFKRLPSETALEDDYPVNPMYVYIIDGFFDRSNCMDQTTVGEYKRQFNVKEMRRCDLFGHPGARLRDKVEE